MRELRGTTIAHLFERHAAAAPAHPAILGASGETLSYAEVNRRANQLAHHLRSLGAGPEQVVGVCLPQTPELLIAVLAVVKSGAAYLPLLPGHPAGRRRQALASTGARLVVTSGELERDGFADRVRVVRTDLDSELVAAAPTVNPDAAGHLDQLLYLIHTSGSTGTPKCIAITHRAVLDRSVDVGYMTFRPDDVCLQLAPLSFDGSAWEIWTTWLNGGTLALPQAGVPFPDALRGALERQPVTTLSLISPQLQLLLTEFPQLLAGIETLLVGGDVLAPEYAQQALRLHPEGRLLHCYGPTECTVFATTEELGEQHAGLPVLPIGRPLPRTTAYVLDERLRVCAPGQAGELWLGGAALARGYAGSAALTAQHFVADPFGLPGGRLYRTGDVVRCLADGRLEFVGRIDGQVKIRGYRVETGEVASVLLRHPGVAAAAVVARDDLPAGRGLVGYLVAPAAGPCVDTGQAESELRGLLADTLPGYMRPAALVWLDRLPLTVNGKLDRAALPAPAPRDRADAAGCPRTPTEVSVHRLWVELLGAPGLGRQDDFFDAGGDSLLLVRLMDQLEGHFPQAGLSLVDLFEFTTCASLAAELDRRSGSRVDELAGLAV
ncbi:amino acid adenylation domain-containing protein [Streptacidiphilus sp. MAP12-20]|uniref:non-ribosomal peptide synthetase n=1 Tax=Streptacidiphilus sp. MAP12-20 TaxID=3156299 RepID=UPI003512AF83